jgi:MoxR-like ATPase
MFQSIDQVQDILAQNNYIADRALATTVYLSHVLKKPIFLEGESGVGKTEVAKVMAKALGARLIRLQCYEGLDANTALYEWNYPKQMLKLKLEEAKGAPADELDSTLFTDEFLLKRPLLEAIQSDSDRPPVLLIDEIDRGDAEFEAFLLEVLSDFQVTIPEIGTIKAKHIPYVVLTSNRTREIHDALKRRCLYLWIDYPSFEKELSIVKAKVPGIEDSLAREVCNFMQAVRRGDYTKRPGIAETLDWAMALISMEQRNLGRDIVEETLGCIFKYKEDIEKIKNDWPDGLG